MFKRIMMFRKKPGMSRQDFIRHYEEVHLPLCMRLLPPPRMHRRNYPIPDDPLSIAMRGDRANAEQLEYDCINEVIHDSREDAEEYFRALSDPTIRARIAADEMNFIEPGSFRVFIVEVRERPK